MEHWERLPPRRRATIGERPPPPGMRLGKAIALADHIRHQFGIGSAQPYHLGGGWYGVAFTYKLRDHYLKSLTEWHSFQSERELRADDLDSERAIARYLARDDDGNVG
jgi:hypothetical protein